MLYFAVIVVTIQRTRRGNRLLEKGEDSVVG